MPVDFGLLQPAAPVSAFFQGQQDIRAEADRNALRQMQAQQMAAQQENLLAQRQERMAHAAQRKAELDRAAESESWLGKMSALFGANKVPLTLDTAREAQLYAVRSRDKNAIDMMNKTVAALEEREALRSAFGPQAAAPAATPAAAPSMMRQAPGAAPAAPVNMFAGTMADIGTTQPAPVNALVAPPQAPATTPAAPAAGGMSRERLQAIIADPDAPKVVVDRAKALLATLPKDQPGARLQDRFVPVGRLVFDRQAQQFITPPQAAIAATQDRAAPAPKEPAAPKPLTAQQETQRRDKLGKEFKTAVNALQTTQDVLDSLQNVKDAPGLNRATGFTGQLPSIPGGAAAQAEVRFQNLKGKVTALGKAQAASTGAIGSIANQEWKILADQIAALELIKGTEPLLEQLDLVEAQAKGAMERIRDAYQRQFGEDFERFPQFKDLPAPKSTIKSRKSGGPVTPSTPQPPATSGKTVRRTGTYEGRRVVEYTDGSVAYAD